MSKVRVGVIGLGRGMTMINYCKKSDNAQLVAVCDKWIDKLEGKKEEFDKIGVATYTSYDEFLNHPMDVVILANYANEHAPFAIKAMEKGLDVFSEVLPCQCLKEAVDLVETIERTGRKYCYLENYCFMPAPAEMRRLYREGVLGEFEYGEGEYVHNCESVWPQLTYGEKDHWRNNVYSTFYCTHSMGPIIHITGLRPVEVTGNEIFSPRTHRVGNKRACVAVELVRLSNGAVFKSLHGGLYMNSIWYSIYGSKGRMESAREDAQSGDVSKIYVNVDNFDGEYTPHPVHSYNPIRPMHEKSIDAGHGGSDFYAMWNAIEFIKGNPDAEVIDVYEALDMYLPGLCAYFSVLEGGIPVKVPDMRDKATRDLYRNDTRCTDPKVAGDQLLPTTSRGTPEIPDEIYDMIRKKFEECPEV